MPKLNQFSTEFSVLCSCIGYTVYVSYINRICWFDFFLREHMTKTLCNLYDTNVTIINRLSVPDYSQYSIKIFCPIAPSLMHGIAFLYVQHCQQCWSVEYARSFLRSYLITLIIEFGEILKYLSLLYLNIRVQDHNIGLFCNYNCTTLHTYFLEIS